MNKKIEYKKCDVCGKILPNTNEYFHGKLCNDCWLVKLKKRNAQKKDRFNTNEISYDNEKVCPKCERSLPNTFRYFPVDKTTNSGLRNICRECFRSGGKFLIEGKELKQPWTDEENELLKSIHMDYSGRELQEKFFPKHTLNSVRTQIHLLGLSGKSEKGIVSGNKFRSNTINEKTGKLYKEEFSEKLSIGIKKYYEDHDHPLKGVKRPEISKLMSELHKGNWVGDKNPRHLNPLYGSQNGKWKDGITSTYVALRSAIRTWQHDSIDYCNNRCIITGEGYDEIHHMIPYRDIVDEAIGNIGIAIQEEISKYSEDEYEKLKNEVVRLHELYGLGACLCLKVHKLFHKLYGYTEFTIYDFLDFIYQIEDGKLNGWFEEHNLQININYEYVDYLKGIIQKMESA